jgi:hypothetical protein
MTKGVEGVRGFDFGATRFKAGVQGIRLREIEQHCRFRVKSFCSVGRQLLTIDALFQDAEGVCV